MILFYALLKHRENKKTRLFSDGRVFNVYCFTQNILSPARLFASMMMVMKLD